MSDLAVLALAAAATAAATGVGAVPVFLLGVERTHRVHAALSGAAAGAMGVAAVAGLLGPGLDEDVWPLVAGTVAGVGFLMVVRRRIERQGESRHWLVVVTVLTAHSLPEGFAIGTAYAADSAALGVFVILAIALQNIPEGTATAMPMQERGFSPAAQVGAAVATSLPQIPGALGAYLLVEEIAPLLPLSFGFAAGAMLALVVLDLLPDARGRQGAAGIAAGAVAMLALAQVAGI